VYHHTRNRHPTPGSGSPARGPFTAVQVAAHGEIVYSRQLIEGFSIVVNGGEQDFAVPLDSATCPDWKTSPP
jgi:hypothetical protein